jgi:hypothetical protein
MSNTWSEFPVWEFCEVKTSRPETYRYAVKIIESVESPYVQEKHQDGPLTIRTLINGTQRLVGYSFTFACKPRVQGFSYSLAASYGVPDTDEMRLVLGSPHLRVLRSGTTQPVYHVVLRHK